jgi:hypothetical protein
MPDYAGCNGLFAGAKVKTGAASSWSLAHRPTPPQAAASITWGGEGHFSQELSHNRDAYHVSVEFVNLDPLCSMVVGCKS